ncbi:hypothetical protein [Patulibacter minatonensis]|uniref:hypothetical protein n=1 Tax=Patulibacter minatonensis TaxID=298163 RepID=UPI00047D2047|nr:hypothetical protein [Patulibacter minatonensis]
MQRADPIAPAPPELHEEPGGGVDTTPPATSAAAAEPAYGPDRAATSWLATGLLLLATLALAAVFAAKLENPQWSVNLVEQTVRAVGAAGFVLFVPGLALARLLTPRRLGRWWPVLILPFGLAGSTLGLTVLALCALRPPVATIVFLLLSLALCVWTFRAGRAQVPKADWPASLAILVGAGGAALLTLLPLVHAGYLTVPGTNPDAHQVIGVAWYLQEAYPLGVHTQTALDKIPAAWSGRIPIFHPFGAAIEVGRSGPIEMFAPFVALLTAGAALGAGLFAAAAHRLPGWGAGLVALLVGGSASVLYSALHPYYNQLYGAALMLPALALAWVWLTEDDPRAGALTILFLVLSLIAYPTTLPYAVLVIAAIAVGARKRPRIPAGVRRRLRRFWPLVVLFFGISVAGALAKLAGVLTQFLGDTPFWQGDINVFPPHGAAYGLANNAWIVPVAMAAIAVLTLWRTGRRAGIAWLALAALLLVLDVILRGRGTAEYVDYKHVTFTALILLPLALGGLVALVAGARGGAAAGTSAEGVAADDRGPASPGSAAASADPAVDAPAPAATAAAAPPAGPAPRWSARRVVPAALGGVLLLAWGAPAYSASKDQVVDTNPNVTPQLFDVVRWSPQIPKGRSVLIDIPATGTQLWATLFLAKDHPVATTDPVSSTTTYSVAPLGKRADYVLGLKLDMETGKPVPPPRWAVGRPILQNDQFGVWRMQLPPAEDRKVPRTASDRLVEPHPEPYGEAARRNLLHITGNPSREKGF